MQSVDGVADVADGAVQGVDVTQYPGLLVGSGELGEHALQAHAGGEQFLDHVVVQVGGDPFAVLQLPQGFLFPAGVLQFQRDAGLAGEPGQVVPVVHGEVGQVLGVRDDQRATHGAVRSEHRYRDDGADAVGQVVQAVGADTRRRSARRAPVSRSG